MIVQKTELHYGLLEPHLRQETSKQRYALRSAALKFAGSVLSYHDGKQEHLFDFSELYFPATTAHPTITRLSDYPHYVDTLLAVADIRIERSNERRPAARVLSRQIYLIRHVLDWLRARGIYRLSDATEGDTRELMAQLAQGGWIQALSLESRWDAVLDQVEAGRIDLSDAFHFRTEKSQVRIETLLQPFWRKQLGWGGIAPITATAKMRLERLVLAWPFTSGWGKRRVSDCEGPSGYVLRNIMGWLNDLATLPASVDRLQHRATKSTTSSAKKLAKKASSRTANLQVSDAVTLISTALKLLYETAPLLLDLYTEARNIYPDLSLNQRRDWLNASPARERLEEAVGKPISKWTRSGHHPRNASNYALDEILAAVQGACAIVLAAMNARRQREICDRHRGVRIGDLVVLDDSLGLYQCWLYIEKTYRDRHVFYVNRTSADALRCLEELKRVCAPFMGGVTENPSLFACGRFVALGPNAAPHFAFSDDSGRTRSLMSFLRVAYDAPTLAPEIASHMFRRFYAILYYHKYEHAELRALKQHLRHLDIAMTRVYVTDPSTRPLAEQIGAALGKTHQEIASLHLKDSLTSEAIDIQNALEEMEREKLRMAVDQILDGDPTAGGFSKIVRKLYRQMLPRVVVEGTAKAAVTDQIMGLFGAHGYRVKPMQHGQCHAPDIRRNLKGACEQDGILAREHATPRICGNCTFHFNNEAYVQNLKEQLNELESDKADFMLSPQQQTRIEFEHKNLSRLIVLTVRKMAINAEMMTELSNQENVSLS